MRMIVDGASVKLIPESDIDADMTAALVAVTRNGGKVQIRPNGLKFGWAGEFPPATDNRDRITPVSGGSGGIMLGGYARPRT